MNWTIVRPPYDGLYLCHILVISGVSTRHSYSPFTKQQSDNAATRLLVHWKTPLDTHFACSVYKGIWRWHRGYCSYNKHKPAIRQRWVWVSACLQCHLKTKTSLSLFFVPELHETRVVHRLIHWSTAKHRVLSSGENPFWILISLKPVNPLTPILPAQCCHLPALQLTLELILVSVRKTRWSKNKWGAIHSSL